MKNRIAFISEHASPLATLGGVDSGGQNVYVAETAKFLAKMGYDIDIFTRCEDPSLSQVVRWLPGIRVVHIKAGCPAPMPKERLLGHMGEFQDGIIAFMMRENIEYSLIHAHFFMSGLVAANLKSLLHIPFVVTFHALGIIRKIYQGKEDGFPAERVAIEKRIVDEADFIIAECPQDEWDLLHYYKACAEKIRIIPCGFNSEEFYPVDRLAAREKLNIPSGEKVILQLGRLVPRKGVDNVIRSLRFLRDAVSSFRLLVVGGECDPEHFESDAEVIRLKQIAAKNGVLDHVDFIGKKSRVELKYYYSAADVFVTTPIYEPFGITPLEAMASGAVVIGSNVGGIKYTVVDGHTGLLVPPEDPEMLAQKITAVLSDHSSYRYMRINALRRVHKMFTWKRVCSLLDKVYLDTIRQTRALPTNWQVRMLTG